MALQKVIVAFLLMTCVKSNIRQRQYVSVVYPNRFTTATIPNRITTSVYPNRATSVISNVSTVSQTTTKEMRFAGYDSLIKIVTNVRLRTEIIIAFAIIGICIAIVIAMCLWKAHDSAKTRDGSESIRPH